MGMIPQGAGEINIQDYAEPTSRTYKLNINKETISGYIDEREAMRQAIYLILNIERYDYLIYSWNYGIELKDLFGQPTFYVMAELERRITEALTADSRITGVDNFEITREGKKVHAKFTVHTIFGDIEAEKVVMI
jgi:hypothetical protein